MRRALFVLFTILGALIIFLRFIGLGKIPQGLTSDEAHYLYDGYSILQTGRDIRGAHYPLMFKSTGEYKLNLTYFVAGAIKLTGLNTLSARLPSSIFGLLSIVLVALLASELTGNIILGLVSSLVLALSPWHFGISRLFYESNVGVFFLLLGLFFSFKLESKRVNKLLFILGAISYGLASYLYNPFRYLGFGLLLLSHLLLYLKYPHQLRSLLGSVLIYLLVLTPMLILAPGNSLKRLSQGIVKSNYDAAFVVDQARSICYLFSHQNPIITKFCYVLWNKPVIYLENYLTSVISLVSPTYLFYESSDLYIIPQNYGAYLSYLLPLYLIGLFVIIRQAIKKDYRSVLILSGLIASIAITSSAFGSLLHKNTFGLTMVILIMVAGLGQIIKWCQTLHISRPLIVVTAILYLGLAILQTSKYLLNYFYLHTVSYPLMFMSDAPDLYHYLESKREYQYIVDNKFFAPIYAGIYWKIDPDKFQHAAIWQEPDRYGFQNVARMDNLYFGGFNVDHFLCLKKAQPDIPIKAIVVDDATGKYRQYASYITKDQTGALELHAVYDIDEIYPRVAGELLCK